VTAAFPWALFAIAIAASAVITDLVRRVAARHHILDHPNERSSHSIPTPVGGGVAIVVVTLSALVLVQALHPMLDPSLFRTISGCALAIAFVSWLDDLRHVPGSIRLLIHLAAGVATAMSVGKMAFWIPFAGVIHIHSGISIAVIALWIAGMTNAFNFMDGIDGIAGLQAVLAGLGFVLLGSITTLPAMIVAGFLLSGSALGFLFENWQPARIFMGDVGSAFLGYMFAALTVIGSVASPRLVTAGAMLVWPFCFDAAYTLIRRLLRHERVFDAHRSHLYQRLVKRGMSHAATALAFGLLEVIGLLAAISITVGSGSSIAVVGVICAAALLVVAVRWRESESRVDHVADRASANRVSTTGT
jgi:glycosyltransferase WbpL